jgi:hypothetical protein
MVRDDLLWNIVHHRPLVDEGSGVEHAIFQALFDYLPNCSLRQAPGVHSFHLLDGCLLPMYQSSLHRHHDGAVVGYLVNGLGHYGIDDGDVPSPELVQMVAFSMCHRAFSECRGESCPHHRSMDFGQLSIQVSSDNDLSLCVLSYDALH